MAAVEILSYGGGTQTVAMCVLVAQGKLPRPDFVIAADTGREMPTTWEYADQYMRPMLASVGLELHIAGHELAGMDLWENNGDLLMPAFTDTGKLPTYCSDKWKARVVRRYARQVLGCGTDIVTWIGFSLDEVNRIKSTESRRFPLVEYMLTAADCKYIIEQAGLPLPHKSRCWMCPHQHNSEWREVRGNADLWRQAMELDQEIRDNDERGGVYLHPQRVPLELADIDADDRREPNRQCAFGVCFV
jgi:3'-phosphoadenosine 5'-phosphosulfate sulfotransferase (PAPS reductase)/FAD synthetase